MTAYETDSSRPESERVERWRLEQLVRAGFDEAAALLLAASRHVDLHRATDLVRQGCPADTAMRILL